MQRLGRIATWMALREEPGTTFALCPAVAHRSSIFCGFETSTFPLPVDLECLSLLNNHDYFNIFQHDQPNSRLLTNGSTPH